MLLTNPCLNDSRVLREAQALARGGHDVTVVATEWPGAPAREERDGFRIVRVPAEPRLAGLVRRIRGLTGGQTDADAGQTGTFGDQTWISAAGNETDGALLLHRPRAAALRFGIRGFLTFRWWRFARSAWAELHGEPADVYLAHDLDTLPIAVRAKSRFGGRVVYDSHELYTDQSVAPPPSWLWRLRWRFVERALIGRADAVMTVCDGISAELADRYGISPPAVVRNIPELVDGAAPDEDLRQRIGIDGGMRVALYLGGIQLNRRLEHYITAIEDLPDVALVLMGPGDPAYIAHLREFAEQAGCAERVRIEGPVAPDRVAAAARGADVGLIVLQRSSLSDWYCLPSKLFESIQAEVPVIANDWPELRRVVQGYGVGVLCASDDPAAIATAIKSVLGDPGEYKRMRENARRASEELNWQAESKRLLAVFDALSSRPADPSDPRSAAEATASR
jgi:glycosyltransferase involved in cell wall biosynthesis